jgi:hypothetical protein
MNFLDALTALKEGRCKAIGIKDANKYLVIVGETLYLQESITKFTYPLNGVNVIWLLSNDWVLVGIKKIVDGWINLYPDSSVGLEWLTKANGHNGVFKTEEDARHGTIAASAKQIHIHEEWEE